MPARTPEDLDRLFAEAMTGNSIEIARRHRDGHWLFAIDEPFGVGA
jgi:hypothetical protein